MSSNLKENKIVDLLNDPEIRQLYHQYQDLVRKLEIDSIKQHHHLNALIRKYGSLEPFSEFDVDTLAIDREQFELAYEASRVYVRLLNLIMPACYFAFQMPEFRIPFKSNRTVDVEFLGIQKGDTGLFTDIDIGYVDQYKPAVRVYVYGNNKFSWISAAWGVTIPSDTDSICGIAIEGGMELSGLVYNKSQSQVTVNMNYGITQYRTGKDLHDINPAVDPPYRNCLACCSDSSNNVYEYGYVDDIYDLHNIESLFADICHPFWKTDYDLILFFPPGELPCETHTMMDMEYGDKFVVGAWCEINVPLNSFVEFGCNGLGTLILYEPSMTYYEIQL